MTEPTDDAAPPAAPRTFIQTLLDQRGGLTHAELTDAFAEVNRAVLAHDKAGTLTLTITVSPTKMDGCVQVSDTIKTKVPEPDRGASLFFADADGNLSRTDPRQPQLPGLRQVGPHTRSA